MPRRRPSQRAKSRSKPRSVDRNDSRLERWETLADIELDEEDQFHTSRDRILLGDGGGADEHGDEEEEVFALRGVSSGEDEDGDGDEDEDPYLVEDDEQGSGAISVDSDAYSEPTTSKSSPKTARDTRKSSPTEGTSDSEEEETWGRSKGAYYSSNAALLDSEDEEANELEEQEALRLQAKAREALCDEDFGLEDVVEGDTVPPEETEQEELPTPPLANAPEDKQSTLRALEKESPETLALARDWDDTAHSLVEAKARVEALKDSESDVLELGLQHMYYQALLTYATTLAFYLHLRATEKYAARPELLRRHPILNRLLTLKEGINTLESLGVGQDIASDDVDDGEEEEEDGLTDEDAEDGDLWSLIKKKGLETGELAGLLEDAATLSPPGSRPKSSPPPSGLSASPSFNPKKPDSAKKERPKRKPSTPAAVHGSDRGTLAPVFDLLEPEFKHTRASRKNKVVPVVDTAAAAAMDPYGEVSALQAHDLSDKQARKKSLRFYVSRIESSSSRRTSARANALGGDDDIPYRERKKERDTRLEKERERKKEKGRLGVGGGDLDDADPEISEEKKRKRKRGIMDDEDAGEEVNGAVGYYDLVKQATAAKKSRKKDEYEAATVRPELEPESASGPRSVTRAILKNKGLTPHRSKAVRNPRVKKRQKYEQAKKKVASQKAVYRGGIGDLSRYSGEQSGISKVVKSVRL